MYLDSNVISTVPTESVPQHLRDGIGNAVKLMYSAYLCICKCTDEGKVSICDREIELDASGERRGEAKTLIWKRNLHRRRFGELTYKSDLLRHCSPFSK